MEDTLYPFLRLYRHLPNRAQNVIGRTYRLLPKHARFGSFYSEYQSRIQQFAKGTESSLMLEMNFALLRETVNNAVQDVPFYLNFSKLTDFDDLLDYPVVSKKELVANPKAFISSKLAAKGLRSNTGGSAGTPMTFYIHAGRTRPKEQAHFDWFWGQTGFSSDSRLLMLRGAPLNNNALCEYQAIKNCLAVSCYELNSSNVKDVIKAIKQFRPQFLHGYPSAVLNFIKCFEEDEKTIWDVPIKYLFLGSEWLSLDDRQTIETFFHSKVLSWYGHSECAVMGGNCLDSHEYFFYPFYGYTELLDENGKRIQKPGEVGRIVATSFDNFVMPFIRYDTGDLGVLSRLESFDNMPCLVLERIEGRSQDFIYLLDNTRVSLTAFIFGQHFPQFSKIRELQLEQHEAGKLTLRIVKGRGYGPEDERNMKDQLIKSVSGRIKMEFEYVGSIEKTSRGKHRFLIQNILVM